MDTTPPPPPPNPDDGSQEPEPRRLTEEFVKRLASLLRQGNYREVAARRLGINPSTFFRWMRLGRKYPNGIYARLRKAVAVAEAQFETRTLHNVCKQAKELDAMDGLKVLGIRHPQRWGAYRGELGELKRRIKELEKLLGPEGNETAGDAAD